MNSGKKHRLAASATPWDKIDESELTPAQLLIATSQRHVVLGFSLVFNLTHAWIFLMQFLFVRPVVCLKLSSDSTSRWTPLLSAMHLALPPVLETFTH